MLPSSQQPFTPLRPSKGSGQQDGLLAQKRGCCRRFLRGMGKHVLVLEGRDPSTD